MMVTTLTCALLLALHVVVGINNEEAKIVAFWHIFAAGEYQNIITEQEQAIHRSGLFPLLHKIYYAVSGPDNEEVGFNHTKFQRLKHHGRKGNELHTLRLLYKYCSEEAHVNDKVLYFHNKGSFHNSEGNTKLRKLLDCFVLSPHCLDVLNEHDTCGMKLTPMPYLHYSGNFWWATSRHVRKLLDPGAAWMNSTFIQFAHYITKNSYTHRENWTLDDIPEDWCIGLGRYFAEAWVGSLPTYEPADCLTADMDTNYVTSIWDLPIDLLGTHCPTNSSTNIYNGYGHKCDTPQLIMNTSMYFLAHERYWKRFKSCINGFNIFERTFNWYGQPAELLMRTMGLPDKMIVAFPGYRPHFVVFNNTFREIKDPNKLRDIYGVTYDPGKTEVVVIPTHKMMYMREGECI